MIPPARDAAFVAAMEALLDLYLAPPDPAVPPVCCDEAGKELQRQTRPPAPPRPGQLAREDPTDARQGSATLVLLCAPHLGWRHLSVTAQRTRIEWAHLMRDLVDVHFPTAARIIVGLDNLNTHRLASLYHTFPAPEARRIARRLDPRFTPLHGSWLNIAELELRARADQCLRRRIPDQPTLAREVAAWVAARTAAGVRVHWQFGPDDARQAMPGVYPHPVCANVALTDHSA